MTEVAKVVWNSNSDNIEFVELIERLANLGVLQQDVARILGVSPGQVSRVKKGERHASVIHLRMLRKHVQRLTKERSSEASGRMFWWRCFSAARWPSTGFPNGCFTTGFST